MLKLASNGGAVINTDDFYIYHKSDGLDQLIFNLSIYDENYPKIVEEAVIEYGQPYLVKAIDGGSDTAKIKCEIDLDELKATLNVAYTNGSATLQNTITNVLPEGWTLMDESGVSIRRTIEGAYTPYDVIMECPETYGIVLQFDAKNRIVHTYDPTKFQPLGSFVSRDLNLKELNYKGKSTGFYTRLYAYGKDGLSFADINDGKPYVDCNTYTDKIICAYWQDDRYEIAENLMEDAQATVDAAGVPQRSYECTVYDLAKTNPDMYGFEDFAMFSVVKLIDDIKGVSLNYQVAELWEYPYYPEKNVVTLSSATPKIQNTVQSIDKSLKPNGTIWNGIQSAQQAASNIINGVKGGYVVFHSNASGQIYEILIMDQPSTETATKVWRWNQNGFGYSPNGYDGPYISAITMDGQIVSSFITTGVLRGASGDSYWNLDTGEMQVAGTIISDQAEITGGYMNISSDNQYQPVVNIQYGDQNSSQQLRSVLMPTYLRSLSNTSGSKQISWISGALGIVCGTYNGTIDNPGDVTAKTSISQGFIQCENLQQTSDARLKEDISDISEDLAKTVILSARPKSFKFKDGKGVNLGFIAQDVREILGPEYNIFIDGKESEGIKKSMSVSYLDFIAPLVKMVQIQQKEIENLKEDIEKWQIKS